MCGVHYTVTALSLELLAVLIHSYCICFVVCKQHHICPLFHKRRYLRRSFLAEFQFPAVISTKLVRLFKLSHLSVSRKHNVDTAVNYLLQEIKELAYLLFFVNIAVAVAEIFNAFFLMCRADRFNAKLFSPIKCINDKGLAEPAVHSFLYLVFEHFPACWLRKTSDVQLLCTALCINKYRVGELSRKGGFAYALRTIYHDFLCGAYNS